MADIKRATEDFVNVIKNRDVYKHYFQMKEKVKAYPELKEKIDEFRWKNFELQTSCEQDELYYKMELFEREYEEFRKNPMVNDFLAAELSFCRMMQNIYSDLADRIEFE